MIEAQVNKVYTESESAGLADLLESFVAEYYVDPTYLQKLWGNSTMRSISLLLRDRLVMTKHLGGGGDKRNQMGKLLTELFDARWVNRKEIVGLSLAGKTRSSNGKLDWTDGRVEGLI